MKRILTYPLGFWLALAGCSGPSSSNEVEAGACERWRAAMCERETSTCGNGDPETCANARKSLQCKSEYAAQSCVNALSTASCDVLPYECKMVIDRQPAIEACEALLLEGCRAVVRCSTDVTQAQCEAEERAKVDCSQAIGVYMERLPQCLEEIKASTCPITVPNVCGGILVLRAG